MPARRIRGTPVRGRPLKGRVLRAPQDERVKIVLDGVPQFEHYIIRLQGRVHSGTRRLVGRWVDRGYRTAGRLCPVNTGFMYSSLEKEIAPDGMSGFIHYDPEAFERAGLEYYPPYVEYGTTRMAAQPSMTPAREVMRHGFLTEMEAMFAAELNR